MNRVSLKIGAMAAVAALSVLFLSLTGGAAIAAQPIGKNGVIHSCFKAKGKNKGTLRVVPGNRSCKRLRGGWRPLSWTAAGSSGASGQGGSQGDDGRQGFQGTPGPEGKQGEQGVAGQVENSLVETINTQTTEINGLHKQVSDLTDEVLGLEGEVGDLSGELGDLEGTVGSLEGAVGGLEDTTGETCEQLKTVTKQGDEVLDSLLGSTVPVLGSLLNLEVPGELKPLGTFECK